MAPRPLNRIILKEKAGFPINPPRRYAIPVYIVNPIVRDTNVLSRHLSAKIQSDLLRSPGWICSRQPGSFCLGMIQMEVTFVESELDDASSDSRIAHLESVSAVIGADLAINFH